MIEEDRRIVSREEYEGVYRDTMYFVDAIVKDYDFYSDILGMIRGGSSEIEVKSRLIKKTVDESWIAAVEEALPALDMAVRSPGRFLQEKEKVLPIELTKTISSRSLRHLAQHTDYISDYDGDNITPSKLLNVFRDETMLTYENKFLNTLIHRLYEFVDKRYRQMFGDASEESTVKLEIKSKFDTGNAQGRFIFGIELDEPAFVEKEKTQDEENANEPTEGILERVKKIHLASLMYIKSDFCASMGTSFVRPPIVRTNALLKNKYLRQCLALWEFIQGYSKIGCKIDIEESAKQPNDSYVKQLYSMLALQYVMFRYNMDHKLDMETLADNTDETFTPEFIKTFNPYDYSRFNISERYDRVSGGDRRIDKHPSSNDRSVERAIDEALEEYRIICEKKAEERRRAELEAALRRKREEEAEAARRKMLERVERMRLAELARKEKRRSEIAGYRSRAKYAKQKMQENSRRTEKDQ